ncbi:MAG: hypothetical protein AAGC56_11690 [Pseudomonadota bacterium]
MDLKRLQTLKRLSEARKRLRESAFKAVRRAKDARLAEAGACEEQSARPLVSTAEATAPVDVEPGALGAYAAYADDRRRKAAARRREAAAFDPDLAEKRAALEAAMQRDVALGRLTETARAACRRDREAAEEAAREGVTLSRRAARRKEPGRT